MDEFFKGLVERTEQYEKYDHFRHSKEKTR
ncbi:hypothetical protein J2755_000184 [Methanohalophilus levihalophilus]|nr:hypothetical protein [Methanohalophilus levihalophilus]